MGARTRRSKKKMAIALTLVGLALVILLVVGVMVANRISPLALGLHKPVFHVDGVALDGYDVTSYFEGEPQKGSSEYATEHDGVTFLFAAPEAHAKFLANPQRYLPEFGGYCTKAVSTGFAAPANPEIFTVKDGSLYIFSSEEVKAEFLKAPQPMVAACEAKWASRGSSPN
jgi:YHS domain-containing protein